MTNFKIDFCTDNNQITNVWHSVFGDTEEDILFFIENCENKKCLGLFEDEKLVSMLFLVDCTYGSLNGKYIYAVATLVEYRGKGYAGVLVEYAKQFACDFLWLIPAGESLVDYYKRFGFDVKFYSDLNAENADTVLFNESKEIVEYLYEGCELKQPIGMAFSENNAIKVGNIK